MMTNDTDVKFTVWLEEPLAVESRIVCTGTPSDDYPWFAVNIGRGIPDYEHGEIAVHFNARQPQDNVVRNTYRYGHWGEEEIAANRSFPFQVGRQFTIEVIIKETESIWMVDDELYCSYAHRSPSPLVAEWVHVTGIKDATLKLL